MSGTSSKSQLITIRLSNETISKIEEALLSPRNGNTSVNDYCKQVIERHAFRHSTRKYKTRIY